ncbi:hypothetical protein PTKIN_Ptkin09bG0118100 [Pterospermum kingtungense]
MGFLMAGWDSPVSDPPSEEEHLKAIYSPSDSCNQLETPCEEYGRRYMRSSSMPLPNITQGFPDMDAETSLDSIIKKNGWWTRSDWAFLNEPPVLDRPTNGYKPQFHIANLSASKLNTDAGISA